MSNTYAIEVSNLVKQYEDVTAVNDLSFKVYEGEIFGLLGPNGAGKSTTINILCGLLEPTSGTASVLGYDLKDALKIKEKIGVCPQEPAVYPYLTGRENVELMGSLQDVEVSVMKKNADSLLEKVGLTEA